MAKPETLARAAAALTEAGDVALACHVGPDGDALGSMLGLAEAASNAGKAVTASFGTPYVVPDNMAFLPTGHLVVPSSFPTHPEVMVVLDAGSSDRLGELAASASNAKTLVILDHHVTNEGFGDISIVDPTAAATGEIVYDLLRLLDWEVTPSVATSLQTALVTDTGRFQYSNTTPRTLEIASELVDAGAQPSLIGQHVYEETPFGYLKAAAAALGRAQLDEELSVVFTYLTQSDLNDAEVEWTDVDGLIDTIRLAREADVAILAKAHGDGRVKVSMRSRGATDVGSLASAMGGGGHRLAAGFTTEHAPEPAIASVISVLKDYR